MLVAGAGALLAADAPAFSYSTPDGSFTAHMAHHFKKYAEENDGRWPTSWQEIEAYTIVPIDEAYKHLTPSRRYAFIEEQVTFTDAWGKKGRVVFAGVKPFRNVQLRMLPFPFDRTLGDPKVYVLYETDDGQIRRYNFSAREFDILLAPTAAIRTAQGDMPERPWITSARRIIWGRRIGVAALVAAVVAVVWRRRKRRSNHAMHSNPESRCARSG